MKKKLYNIDMHHEGRRERERLAYKATQPLAKGSVPAFDVGGFTAFLPHRTVLIVRNDRRVGSPTIAGTGTLTMAGRDGLPQLPTRIRAAVTHGIRHHVARVTTPRNPNPYGIRVIADKGPDLIKLQDACVDIIWVRRKDGRR